MAGIAGVDGASGGLVAEAGARFTISGTTVTNSSATGGAGGSGIKPTKGVGGNGANSFGGGISLDPGSSFAA
jgi:hypothetical protein